MKVSSGDNWNFFLMSEGASGPPLASSVITPDASADSTRGERTAYSAGIGWPHCAPPKRRRRDDRKEVGGRRLERTREGEEDAGKEE